VGGYPSNFETALGLNKPEWWDSQAERKCDDTFSHFDAHQGKGKGKGSSLAIAPLTILDSGAFTTSEVAADWHWL